MSGDKRQFLTSAVTEELDSMPGGVLIYTGDEKEEILYANTQLIESFGCDSLEDFLDLTGGSFRALPHPDDRARVEHEIREQLQKEDGDFYFLNCRVVCRDGSVLPVDAFGHRTEDSESGFLFHVFFVRNSFRTRLLKAMKAIPMTGISQDLDSLTGLLSMRAFLAVMEDQRASGVLNTSPVAVLYVDIANFRLINIRYGLTAGDEFLHTLGRSLRGLFSNGAVARFDVDHFAILTDASNLQHKAETIRSIIRQLAPSDVDCSIGACVWQDPSIEPVTICNRAKAASDDNRSHILTYFSIYTEKLGEQLDIARYVVSSIDEAIRKDWIRVYYQPLVRTLTGQLCGLEALARWDDPTRGLLPPVDFIGPLEDAEIIWKLDLYVIRKVVQNIASCKEKGLHQIPVSINLSRMDFLYCDIFQEIESIVKTFGIDRHLLHIEVTESIVTSKESVIYESLDHFRDAGYEIWMDDFGSGYSTLNLLKDYRFDVLKLDMAFLRSNTERSREIIASVIAMDKKIGLRTLAEGVETKEQADFLMKQGCEKLQGYYYSRPLPFEEIMQTCRKKGIRIEPLSLKEYYDAVSETDLMTDEREMLLEQVGNRFHVLYVNKAEVDALKKRDIDSVEELEDIYNDLSRPASVHFRQFLDGIRDTRKVHQYDYTTWNCYFRCRIREIAVAENRRAYVIETQTLSRDDSSSAPEESLPESTYYEFTDNLLIGVEKIDEEHRRFFDHANQAIDLLRDSDYVPDRARQLIHEIKEHTSLHFRDEEAYMKQTADPVLPLQKIQHEQFLEAASSINEETLTRETYIESVNFIVQWLYRHIMGTDTMIGKLKENSVNKQENKKDRGSEE